MKEDLAVRLKAKVEALISRCETLDRENAELKIKLSRYEKSIVNKDNRIKELEKQTDNLQLKEAFLGTSGDRAQARRKIAGLIREIDECVGLLDD